MRPDEKDIAFLWDILTACRRVNAFIKGMDQESFEKNPMCHFAVIAQYEIIGEATKRLSKGFQETKPNVPWDKMAKMRDFLIHHYDRVKLGTTVWETATVSVPELVGQIAPLLDESPSE